MSAGAEGAMREREEKRSERWRMERMVRMRGYATPDRARCDEQGGGRARQPRQRPSDAFVGLEFRGPGSSMMTRRTN